MHCADQDNSMDSDIETLDGDNDNNHSHILAFIGQDNPMAKEMQDNIPKQCGRIIKMFWWIMQWMSWILTT